MKRNAGFENSLRCLQHPASLLSIVLLYFNDHVFKSASPSWLTGKISDFAGLFFFPFIVTACLSLLVIRFNVTTKFIGKFAFGFAGIWFCLLKTSPHINSATSQVASWVVGFPTQFMLDWTDLIALGVMMPAWKLWAQPLAWNRTNFAYVALSIGALAAIATSPSYPTVYSVTDLEYYQDGVVYAADRENYNELYPQIAISNDGGLSWQEANIESIELNGLPILHCSHLHPELCFRVEKKGVFEESSNRGNSWAQVATAARDLILFEWEGREYVIVALGERGLLRKELPDKDWQIIPVLEANK